VRRFIPTRVGNTAAGKVEDIQLTVHPHTRGEHTRRRWREGSGAGSSPHAWGTLDSTSHEAVLRRFIPTRVGNTLSQVTAAEPPIGSSPHAWGTLKDPPRNVAILRFIPTRVGNTECREFSGGAFSVHPHTRGEHSSRHSGTEPAIGSSPHAWGTHPPFGRKTQPGRFIPTRVGNTSAVSATVILLPVHPHTRGEHP